MCQSVWGRANLGRDFMGFLKCSEKFLENFVTVLPSANASILPAFFFFKEIMLKYI